VTLALLFPLALLAADLTQTVALQAGWNSVWLEVTPAEATPQAVFGGTAVDVVAGYYPMATTVQFISDPSEATWKEPGWGLWYAPSRAESALNNLAALDGGRAYLVHALSAGPVTVRGVPACKPLRWTANSLNFVGLPVDPASAPTFGEFFAGSGAHGSVRVYRLTEGCWRLLSSPSTTPIVRGVAYWIYCTGRSEWQGPLEVAAGGDSGVSFGATLSTSEWRLTNRSDVPVTAVLERVCGDLPLCTERLAAEALVFPPLSGVQSLGQIAASSAVLVRLQVRREQMSSPEQDALLSVRGGGCLSHIPVTASRGTP